MLTGRDIAGDEAAAPVAGLPDAVVAGLDAASETAGVASSAKRHTSTVSAAQATLRRTVAPRSDTLPYPLSGGVARVRLKPMAARGPSLH